jgi:hypothetical protein
MSIGRFLSYFILVIIGGLIQFWVLLLVFKMQGQEIKIELLLKDGSLFFFSTSLAYSSLYTLIVKHPLKLGGAPLNISLLAIGIISVTSLVVYATINNHKIQTYLFPIDSFQVIQSQVFVVIASLVYSLYVATVTGLFAKEI